jgi:hypothetical protein
MRLNIDITTINRTREEISREGANAYKRRIMDVAVQSPNITEVAAAVYGLFDDDADGDGSNGIDKFREMVCMAVAGAMMNLTYGDKPPPQLTVSYVWRRYIERKKQEEELTDSQIIVGLTAMIERHLRSGFDLLDLVTTMTDVDAQGSA